MTSSAPLARVVALTAKADRARWSARTDLDWWTPITPPDGIPVAGYVDTISQLFHAEQATLALLGRLRHALPEPEARAFVATQILDEERHAQVYRGYLERLGDVAPLDPGLADLFAEVRAWTGPAWALVVALHIVMEHEVLPEQHRRIATLPCRLLRQINARVAADEARHAGFGVLYLAHTLPRTTVDERAAVTTWLGRLWSQYRAAARGRDRAAGPALVHPDRHDLERRAHRVGAALRALGLTTLADPLAAAA